eukprot:SAG31_NODE_1292_length_8967_cov_2.998985_12_plen_158_part_00
MPLPVAYSVAARNLVHLLRAGLARILHCLIRSYSDLLDIKFKFVECRSWLLPNSVLKYCKKSTMLYRQYLLEYLLEHRYRQYLVQLYIAVWNTCLLNLLPKYSLLNLLPKLEHRYRQYRVQSCLEYLPTEFITEVQPTKFVTGSTAVLNLVPVVQPY